MNCCGPQIYQDLLEEKGELLAALTCGSSHNHRETLNAWDAISSS